MLERKHEQIAHEAWFNGRAQPDGIDPVDDIRDDVLRLIFIACHPVLSIDSRVALTLGLVGGLTTVEISRAFLVAEPVIAQRIVRAKRTLAEARIPFEAPGKAERAGRLASVLEALYLIFNEGYAATAGDDVIRPVLCEDALRLGRVLAKLARRSRSARTRCAHGNPSLTHAGARRTGGRADLVARSRPREVREVGSSARSPRPCCA